MKNTITGIKMLMGKRFESSEVQNELGEVAYRMVSHAGKVGLPVREEPSCARPAPPMPCDSHAQCALCVRSDGVPTATQVMYNDEEVIMTPEKCMGMLLKCMQKIAEKSQGAPVTDCVLTVISERHPSAIMAPSELL